jgi:hypothetical protein
MIEFLLSLWLSSSQHADARIARLEAALVEKDRQIAELHYQTGIARLDLQRKALEAEAAAVECQLTTRALSVVERLRILEAPPSGAPFDFKTGTWLLPTKERK